MRPIVITALAAVAALTVASCGEEAEGPEELAAERRAGPDRLVVLFTTDEHSHVLAVGPEGDDWPLASAPGDGTLVGGIARRKTVLDAERASAAERGASAVVVSAGDFSQGTLAGVAFVPSAPDLALMKALSYDVVALGNHEFDLGPAALAAAIAGSASRDEAPPLVLTNLHVDDAHPLAALHGARGSDKPITTSRVVNARDRRIGFVAIMGWDAARAAFAAAPVRFAEVTNPSDRAAFLAAVAARLQAEIDDLRGPGRADAVVLLGHGGISGDPSSPGDDERLVPLLSGVDLVVSGHTHLAGRRLVTARDGRAVPVVQPPPYGRAVGREELVFEGGDRPRVDDARAAFLPVDDRTLPTTASRVVNAIEEMIAGLEAAFVGPTLAAILPGAVTDDPAVAGDVYFYELCRTTFDVVGLRQPGETNGLNLDTDAMKAVAAGIGAPAEIALQASGAVRADFAAGAISFADVFRMAPLGADPTTGTPGYPLIRAFMSTAELRAALEGTLALALGSPDFYVSPSGLRVEYDAARAPFDPADPLGPGWITRLSLVGDDGTETTLYDAAIAAPGLPPGWTSHPLAMRSVVTTYQVGAFAGALGVTLRDAEGMPVALDDAVLTWPGTTATVKDHQALARYLAGACAANGGELPGTYDEASFLGAVPRRIVCEGLACP